MWSWLTRLHQYVNRLTNQILGRRTVSRLIDANILSHQADILALNQRLFDDAITLDQWHREMRQHIKDATIQQYLLGRGGSSQVSQIEWGSVGGQISEQFSWLDKFSQEIASGQLTPGQIDRRSVMYIASSREAFEKGKLASYGIPFDRLSHIPGRGDTQCLTNCRCWLDIEDKSTLWRVFWRMTPEAESCNDCIRLSAEWNPLIIEKV